MSALTRWKLACALLAGLAALATVSAYRRSGNAPVSGVSALSDRGGPQHLTRPWRISAEAAGLSRAELVEHALSARTLRDLKALTEKLGAVGDDETVRQLRPLLDDPRRGFSGAVLGIYGVIATERAVETLVAYTKDDRPDVRMAAISALASTHTVEAEELLTSLAQGTATRWRIDVLEALGSMRSDRVVPVLAQLAITSDYWIARAAVLALGASGTPVANRALRALVKAPDRRIAAVALSAIRTIDEGLLAQLVDLIRTGDPQLVKPAIDALGRAGKAGLPFLEELALHGGPDTRHVAVSALGEIGGAEATRVLSEVLRTGDHYAASFAARELLANGGPVARELLIHAALSDRAQITGTPEQLALLVGEDIDQTLVRVMTNGPSAGRRAVLPRLLKAGNPEAFRTALEMSRRGSSTDRAQAMGMLLNVGTPKAFDAVIELASKHRGYSRLEILAKVAESSRRAPGLVRLLDDSMVSGNEATYAAHLLAQVATDESRSALHAALTGKDRALAAQVANAIAGEDMSGEIKTAVLAIALDNPQGSLQVMRYLIASDAPEGLQLAKDMIDGNDPEAAQAAVSMLTVHDTDESRRLLDRALDSTHAEVRLSAIRAMAQSSGEKATNLLVRLARDKDPTVRATALVTLGEIGSEEAQRVLLETTRSGTAEDRVAAISSLASMDDARASHELAALIRDPDPLVAKTAIESSSNAGREVDVALTSIVNDPRSTAEMKATAASQLRARGAPLDAATEKKVTALVDHPIGGAGTGGGERVDL